MGKSTQKPSSFRVTFWKSTPETVWKIAVKIILTIWRAIIGRKKKSIAIFHSHSVFYGALLPLITVLDTFNFKYRKGEEERSHLEFVSVRSKISSCAFAKSLLLIQRFSVSFYFQRHLQFDKHVHTHNLISSSLIYSLDKYLLSVLTVLGTNNDEGDGFKFCLFAHVPQIYISSLYSFL